MGTTNFGQQTRVYSYHLEASGQNFNKLLYGIAPAGIYSGFELTRINDSTVRVGAGQCYIEDSTTKIGINIRCLSDTSSVGDIACSSSTPYIVLRYTWSDNENNYMDILSVSLGGIQTDDIIIGKCEYSGSVLVSFDYSEQDEASIKYLNDNYSAFHVSKGTGNYGLNISAGKANINGNIIEYTGGTYTLTGGDTTLGRIDLIYIKDDGNIDEVNGSDAGSPTIPTFPADGLVIATITRGASSTAILGSEIENIQPNREMSNSYDNSTSGLTATDFQSAIDELETEKVNYTDIVNDLTTGGTAVPLSAEQGNILLTKPFNPSSKNGDYTILDNDDINLIYVTASSVNITITLPTAADNTNRKIKVMKVDSTNYEILVLPEGSENLNGLNFAWRITEQYDYVEVVSNGTGWYVTDKNIGSIIEFKTTTRSSNLASAYQTSGANSVYNISGYEILVTPGVWELSMSFANQVVLKAQGSITSIRAKTTLCLSTSTSTLGTDVASYSGGRVDAAYSTGYSNHLADTYVGSAIISVASNTTYYTNIKINYSPTTSGTLNELYFENTETAGVIKARRIA